LSRTERFVTGAWARGSQGSASPWDRLWASYPQAGVPLYSSEIFTTTDDGATWSTSLPPIDPTLVLETLDIAATDPMRIYVSGIRGVGASTVGVLLESRDGGMTFVEHDIPLDLTNEAAPYIAAIDPTNADRVYLRTSPILTTSPTRVILFDASMADASTGQTTLVTTMDPALGFAIAPDASKIYVGSLAGGLLVASTSDNVFHQTSTIRVRCLRSTGTTLYACSDEVSGFIIGSSADDGASFTPLLHLSTIRGSLVCPATATVSTIDCADMWPAQQEQLGVTPSSDAGSSDGGSSGAPSTASSSKSCGCRAVPEGGEGAGVGAALVGALGLTLRRRSRQGAPRGRKKRG
jgi:MYXO-CTERM domain-containing protein